MKPFLIIYLLHLLLLPLVLGQYETESDHLILKPKIIGGENASPGEFPFVVAIHQKTIIEDRFLCAGILIREDLVLTSALCADLTSPLREYNVYAGAHNISNLQRDPNVQTVSVSAFVKHPDYAYNSTYINPADLALAHLSSSLTLTERVQTIALPGNDDVPREDSGMVVGWGSTNASQWSEESSILQKLDVSFVDNETCSGRYKNQIGFDPNLQFCAGDRNHDICYIGDLGGPFLVGEGSSKTLYALISIGGVCDDRDSDAGSLYTRLPPFVSWIESEMLKEQLNFNN